MSPTSVFWIVAVCLVSNVWTTGVYTCPCELSPDTHPRKPKLHQQHLLCIEDTVIARQLFFSLSPRSLNLNYRHMNDDLTENEEGSDSSTTHNLDSCDVLLKVAMKTRVIPLKTERCPGSCKKIPFVLLPSYFMVSLLNSTSSIFQMCSMSYTLGDRKMEVSDKHLHIGQVLRAISVRRLQECEENKNPLVGNWDYVEENSMKHSNTEYNGTNSRLHSVPQSANLQMTTRTVHGVVIWVGSLRRSQMIQSQMSVLRLQGEGIADYQRVVGWAASEEVYQCGPGLASCDSSVSSVYMEHMPSTVINQRSTTEGWACAQRRPLRAMAHVIKLYSADFLLVVDDDSYVNMKLLSYGSVLSSHILHTMNKSPLVYGDLRTGVITARGFFFGGGGYLIGRAVVDLLVSHEIIGLRSDVLHPMLHSHQLGALGVLNETLNNREDRCKNCAHVQRIFPINSTDAVYKRASLDIRVVDLCVNMMAQSGTCYHSDHSISRCLAHAIYADLSNAGCDAVSFSSEGRNGSISMCFNGDHCDRATALVCHRHVADSVNPALSPIPQKFQTNY